MTVTAVTALAHLCMTSQVFEKLCLVVVARVASASSRCLCECGAVQFTLQRLLFAGKSKVVDRSKFFNCRAFQLNDEKARAMRYTKKDERDI